MKIFFNHAEPRFELGQLVMTAEANHRLAAEAVQAALMRHLSGDWGEVCAADATMNEEALIRGGRIRSVYGEGEKRFQIVTEGDGSMTRILLLEERV